MFNDDMENAIQQLVDLMHDPRTKPALRARLESILDETMRGRRNYEDFIHDLQTQLLRNPSFAGDLMGMWEDLDIFEDDDPDDHIEVDGSEYLRRLDEDENPDDLLQ